MYINFKMLGAKDTLFNLVMTFDIDPFCQRKSFTCGNTNILNLSMDHQLPQLFDDLRLKVDNSGET